MRKGKWLLVLSLILIGLLLVAGCGKQETGGETKEKQGSEQSNQDIAKNNYDENTLVAVKADQKPKLDGSIEDVWTKANPMKVVLENAAMIQGGTGGKFQEGKTEIEIRALYNDEEVFFVAQWQDPTESTVRGPWIYENGQWVKKSYNEFYEDKLAFIWNKDDSIADFNSTAGSGGCSTTCHVTEFKTEDGKPIMKKNTNAQGEIGDMWHWKLVRLNDVFGKNEPGFIHDQYVDSIQFDPNDPKTKSAGRHADPGPKEYEDNITGDSKNPGTPKFVIDGEPAVSPYVIIDGLDKVKPFDPNQKYNEGDIIPGLIAKQIAEDTGDISAKGRYQDGVWTLEWSRKLSTGSEYDIDFSDTSKTYWFGVAAFDNSQIGHAYHGGGKKLVFE